MSKTLVTFDREYQDDFQCQEYIIVDMSVSKANKHIGKLIDGKLKDDDDDEPLTEVSFGTNESFEVDGLKLSDFRAQKISEAQAVSLHHLMGSNFGTGILSNFFDAWEPKVLDMVITDERQEVLKVDNAPIWPFPPLKD